MNEESLKDQAN